jgi:hypothetical protein
MKNRENFIDALLGHTALDSLLEIEGAYTAATHMVEGVLDNEDLNGPGTYTSWSNAPDVVEAYASSFERELPDDAWPIIIKAVDHAIALLKSVGDDFDMVVAYEELERLEDPTFGRKLEDAIRKVIEEELASGRRYNLLECDANEGLEVEVNGFYLKINVTIAQDWVNREACKDYTDVEWEALTIEERDEFERNALSVTVDDVLRNGLAEHIATNTDTEKQIVRFREAAQYTVRSRTEALVEEA